MCQDTNVSEHLVKQYSLHTKKKPLYSTGAYNNLYWPRIMREPMAQFENYMEDSHRQE